MEVERKEKNREQKNDRRQAVGSAAAFL